MIHVFNVRTIFGHTATSDNFWSEIYPICRTLDEIGQFFSETGAASRYCSVF